MKANTFSDANTSSIFSLHYYIVILEVVTRSPLLLPLDSFYECHNQGAITEERLTAKK